MFFSPCSFLSFRWSEAENDYEVFTKWTGFGASYNSWLSLSTSFAPIHSDYIRKAIKNARGLKGNKKTFTVYAKTFTDSGFSSFLKSLRDVVVEERTANKNEEDTSEAEDRAEPENSEENSNTEEENRTLIDLVQEYEDMTINKK